MTQDELYLTKLKKAGWPDKQIAAKMGLRVEEVSALWEKVKRDARATLSNGFPDLCNQFEIMLNQYQLLGESLKIFAEHMNQIVTVSQIDDLCQGTPEEICEHLKNECMVFRAFVPPPPRIAEDQNVIGN